MAKMTTKQKLDQARAMVLKYEADLAAEAIRDNIEQGDSVTFKFGRGNTKRELTGTVLGVKDDNNGRWVRVTAGEGFDMAVYTIRTADITKNPNADARTATAGKGKGKAMEAPSPAVKSDPLEDPLAAE